jgi:hypothetical protein
MKLANKNSGSIEPKPEQPIVQWTQLLLAIAAVFTGLSQVINAFRHSNL